MNEFTPAPVKPLVTIDALESFDIRVGTIERVEEVSLSEKLMKLTVNFGDHSRTFSQGSRKSEPIRVR
ncbi:MAG TPA: hypothetical protein VKH63_19785 [Candidatus Acidoferrum sp.]|nr:hypothetical protein [Candidatus Acidoferrum sp.]